jgi:hypothetical protein
VGRCNNGFRHRLTRIDSLGLHGHLGNCGSIDKDGHLPTVPHGRRLAGASEDVLRGSYLHAQCHKQYRHRSRISIHKSILEPRVFTSEHQPPVINLVPSTDGRANRTAEPNDGAVSSGLRYVRAGQLG